MGAHNVRVDDHVWTRATERARRENTTISALVGRWLAQYAEGAPPLIRMDTQVIADLYRIADRIAASCDVPQASDDVELRIYDVCRSCWDKRWPGQKSLGESLTSRSRARRQATPEPRVCYFCGDVSASGLRVRYDDEEGFEPI